MKYFKKGQIPDLDFQKAVKKPIPIRCVQLDVPFRVETMEGVMEGKAGDWLGGGGQGEMYPIDAEIFSKTYDLVR